MSRFGRVLTKFGIVGGSIYGTSDLGVWGDDPEKVYRTVCNFATPYVKEIPVELPELPKVANMTSTAKNYWNGGVLKTGQFLYHLPETTASWTNQAYTLISAQLNPPTQNP